MLKLFATGKKKKSGIKPGLLKIPIPMLSGVQYADMTESQISTLISGENKSDQPLKKSASSITSQKTNNTTEKTPVVPPVPSRSISSPPNLVMPKAVYSLPPTRFLFKSHDYEKTQVESSEDEEESFSGEDSSDESDIIELFPSNIVTADHTTTNKEINHKKLSPIEEKSPIESLSISEGVVIPNLESPRQESDKSHHQSLDSVTRTSDDSIRHYTSATGSPFFTASVSHLSNNLANDTPFFSSLLDNSFINQKPSSNHNDITLIENPASFASAGPSNTNFSEKSPQMSPNSISQDIVESPININDSAIIADDYRNTTVIQPMPSPSKMVAQNSTTTQTNQREQTPLRYSDASISPQPTTKQTKVNRPSSSSASSATIGLAVTPTSQSRYSNNSDKPPGNQSQPSESSSFVAFQNNNNTKNLLMPLENTSRSHSLAISDIQHNMKKMVLTEDLEQLKRTVDRMQQQRVSDREEHLNRVKEQKLREKEILDQINLTKQRLEMAIAGKFFMEDLNNTNDADNNAITATLGQRTVNNLEHLQHPNKGLNGFTIEEEHMAKSIPPIKPSISASSAKSRGKEDLIDATKLPLNNSQPENGRPKGLHKQTPNASNRHSYHQESALESYFPDASETDFEYLYQLNGPAPKQFFSLNIPKFGNMRNNNSEMDFENSRNRYDLFDPPRARDMRNHPQQQPRRERSKSVESKWIPPQEFINQQQHIQQQQQQQQHNLPYHVAESSDGNRFFNPGYVRSRKSSTHSARSNRSEGTGIGEDSHNGYHSAAEKDGDDEKYDEDDFENDISRHRINNGTSGRLDSDVERIQQFHDDERLSRNSSGGRYRRRPQPPWINGHMPPSMIYHNQAFDPPPPQMSHMGMMNDRDRMKLRPLPSYGYKNMTPALNEYYPYIPKRVSPRTMAAFNEDQHWNAPPHHPQWARSNQKMFGVPPPKPETMGNGTAANGATVLKGHHLQDASNESNFGRRYLPAPAVNLQQTPQQSQHRHMGVYPDTLHRLYM